MALLEVRGLVKFYGRRKVVDGVSFEVNAGEVVGLLGPNGAGKTTSFRMTTGQITPNDGEVIFNSVDVTSMPMYQRARLGMGYLSQEQSVFRKLSVEKNILAILEALPKSRSLGRPLRRSERWDRCDKVLEQFGLTHVRHTVAARCSGGEKRRLEIARCLVCEPLLILLDEPFAAVDPLTTNDIRQIIRELAQQNIGILLTDHNVREVLKITDRSYLIKDGRVRTHGKPLELIHDPIAINEYLGTTFSDDGLGPAPTMSRRSGTEAFAMGHRVLAPGEGIATAPLLVSQVLEEERLRQWVLDLRDDATARQAASELVQRKAAAIPALLDGLERREIEIRFRAFQILQHLFADPLAFDPYAPEEMRSQQLLQLRERLLLRKAG